MAAIAKWWKMRCTRCTAKWKAKENEMNESQGGNGIFFLYELRVQMLRQKGGKQKELIVGIARSAS